MGRRGLYPSLSTTKKNKGVINYMSFLQYADGKNELNDIAKILSLTLYQTRKILKVLKKNKLIEC